MRVEALDGSLTRQIELPGPTVQLAEPKVTMGGEWAHAELLGERQCIAVEALSVLAAACRRDVPGEAERLGLACPSPQPAAER